MSVNLYYDDFEIGKEYPVFSYSISQEELNTHRNSYSYVLEGLETSNDVPSDVISPFALNSFLAIRASFGMPDGVLHAREKMVLHKPAFASDQLHVKLHVLDKYKKNGRPFIVFRHTVTRQDDQPVMDIDRTICWIQKQGEA